MRWIKGFLLLVLMELAHFLLFSILVGWLGRWQLDNAMDLLELVAWVWVGVASFWSGGLGTKILAACMVAAGAVILGQGIQWLGFAQKKAEMNAELRRKEEELRLALHEEITQRVIAEQNSRERSLDAYKERLNQGFRELASREASLGELQEKSSHWREELRSIQANMEKVREKNRKLRRRAGWALAALDSEPPNPALARRHLKRMAKNR